MLAFKMLNLSTSPLETCPIAKSAVALMISLNRSLDFSVINLESFKRLSPSSCSSVRSFKLYDAAAALAYGLFGVGMGLQAMMLPVLLSAPSFGLGTEREVARMLGLSAFPGAVATVVMMQGAYTSGL